MTREIDHFLAACLRGEKPAFPPGWDAGLGDQIARRILFHGVALALCNDGPLPQDWPASLRDRVMHEARLQVMWEETHRAVIARVLDGLAAAGVQARVLKGTALAYSLYDQPAIRRRGDTDIMIRRQDLDQVRVVLRGSGLHPADTPYGQLTQETWHHDSGQGTRHVIDLHWQANECVALQQALPVAAHFDRPVALPRLAAGAAMPPLVLTFLHLAINRSWHGLHGYSVERELVTDGDRLIWAMDLALLLRHFSPEDWQDLPALARRCGLGGLVADALGFARDALAAPVPGGLVEELSREPGDTPAMRYLGMTSRRARLGMDLSAMPGLVGRIAMLAQLGFPPASHIRQSHPALARWPLPLGWLVWFGGRLARLVRGAPA